MWAAFEETLTHLTDFCPFVSVSPIVLNSTPKKCTDQSQNSEIFQSILEIPGITQEFWYE